MNEVSTQLRSLSEITASIKLHAQHAAGHIIAIGTDLMDAKAQLSHGSWLPWLERVGISSRTADNYMRLAEASKETPALADMGYSKALALLEAPQALRDQLMEDGVEDKSAAEIKRLTKELKQAQEEASKVSALQQAVADKDNTIKGWQMSYEELRKRPEVRTVEVTK